MRPIEVAYSHVQTAKGQPRVWMEGRALARAGFTPGDRYSRRMDAESGVITLQLDQDGEYIVSERKAKNTPIIEIQNRKIQEVFGGLEELRIDYFRGEIRISVDALARKQVERETRLREEVAKGEISEGTLCAGGGMSTLALTEAFEQSGLIASQRWIVDREGKYLNVAASNNPAIQSDTQIFEASLERLEPELLHPVSVVNVSLPCSGHSQSGKSKNGIKNAEDHRTDATAIFGLQRVVEGVNPSIIVSENVPQAQSSATYSLLRGFLDYAGYNVAEVVLDSEQSGTFQNRKRYWLVAVSKGLTAVDLSDVPAFARQYAKLGELMDHVPADSSRWAANQYLKDKAIRDKSEGKGFQRNLVNEDSERLSTVNRTYWKKQSTPPMVQREDGMERLLTPNEIARSMACPESLVDGVSNTLAIEILGQGVDMNQCRGIGLAIVRDVIGALRGAGEAVNDVLETVTAEMSSAAEEQLHLFGAVEAA